MHWIDYFLIFAYLGVVFAIGAFFFKRQSRIDEYFVGDRKMGTAHIGLSVVATDVGGGFSIGLGGLGFAMGLAGSWLLFTGLIGAWMAAVLLIPRVKALGDEHGYLTYPDFLETRFDGRVRLLAALVSGIGYAGFVGGQVLAGGKLCAAAFEIDLVTAVLIMSVVVIVYTAFGGLQAVIYTDTFQWAVLLIGLSLVAFPLAFFRAGGWEAVRHQLPEGHLDLFNVSPTQFVVWMLTIVPIWFVGMTLYQRIYATKDVKTAQRAWYLAGLLEWPLMAFLGVTLGMFSRILYPAVEAEMGLPTLIRDVMPAGLAGLVMAAYFSAIMSTADSCLLASAGNFTNDIYQKYIRPDAPEKRVLAVSRWVTVALGAASVGLALLLPTVLEMILLSYSFMVSGLFAPTLCGLLFKGGTPKAALWSMAAGGGSAVLFELVSGPDPPVAPILGSLPLSFAVYAAFSWADARSAAKG